MGTLLGDACIPLNSGNPSLRVDFIQTIARAKYIWHLYDLFEYFVGTPPRVYNIRGGGARDRKHIWFRTYAHPELKFYDDLFYLDYKYKGGGRVGCGAAGFHKIFIKACKSTRILGRRDL